MSYSKTPYPGVTHPAEGPFQWAVPYWTFGPYRASLNGRYYGLTRVYALVCMGRTIDAQDGCAMTDPLTPYPMRERARLKAEDAQLYIGYEMERIEMVRAEDIQNEMFQRLSVDFLPQVLARIRNTIETP